MNLGSLDLILVVAISTVLVLVLVSTILIVGLAVVLHGRKTGWSDLVCHRWRAVTGISLVEICCGCLRDVFLDVIWAIVAIAGAGTGDVCLSRSRALTISFNSATSGDTPEVEELVLTLATTALLQELRTLDLLSMMLEQSAGLLSKKLPPAAEFKESEAV
ncbi:hypothetical protein Tco_0263670 [Tanacetum coccineum]